jgi:hypothetical protein
VNQLVDEIVVEAPITKQEISEINAPFVFLLWHTNIILIALMGFWGFGVLGFWGFKKGFSGN